jgi:hypothetical protein
MQVTRKYDKRKVIHTKYGEGEINGVDLSLRHSRVGVNFKEGEDIVFRMFTLPTFNLFIMLIFNRVKIKHQS